MRKLFVFYVIPLLLIANTAFGEADLQGCWYVEIECIGTPPPGEPFYLSIEDQDQDLFVVINCDDEDANHCYGAIDGKNVYITCWDNIVTGRVGKNGTEMNFITQNQNPDGKKAGTCKGTATKIDDLPCDIRPGCPPGT